MMFRSLLEPILVKLLLAIAMFAVQLFNSMDDGPTDYQIVERERPAPPPF